MSQDDILRAHIKEIFELRIEELVTKLEITEEMALNYLFVLIMMYDRGIKLDINDIK